MARLKKAEALRRKTAILLGKGTLRLPSLLQTRKLEVKKRIRIEQDLLLAYFNSQQVPSQLTESGGMCTNAMTDPSRVSLRNRDDP